MGIIVAETCVLARVVIVARTSMATSFPAAKGVGAAETHASRLAANVAYPPSSLKAVGTLSQQTPSALPVSSGRRSLWPRWRWSQAKSRPFGNMYSEFCNVAADQRLAGGVSSSAVCFRIQIGSNSYEDSKVFLR